MQKKIMILGASVLQLPAIIQAKEMGIEVISIDMNPNAIGFNYADKHYVVSTIDIDAVLELAKKEQIDGIMTLASDMPMRTVAVVAKEMGLVGVDEQTALKATNKAVMRQVLFEAGVPIPKFFKVSSPQEYADAVKQFNSKFIVKPADNSGSRGIFLVENNDDAEKVNQAYIYSKKFSRNGDIVVETFMEGREVSVETLSIDGECYVMQITDKLTTGAPHFVEMGHSQPSKHPIEVVNKIKEVAISAVKAIGIKNGPSHTEIMVTPDGPMIVEVGARLGGDCITTHLVPLSTGVNMVKNCILIALGEKPDLTKTIQKGSAIRYIPSCQGQLKEISNVNDAKNLDGVKEITFVKQIGEQLTNIESSTERVGFVVAQGETAEDAVDICNKALNKIKIVIE